MDLSPSRLPELGAMDRAFTQCLEGKQDRVEPLAQTLRTDRKVAKVPLHGRGELAGVAVAKRVHRFSQHPGKTHQSDRAVNAASLVDIELCCGAAMAAHSKVLHEG